MYADEQNGFRGNGNCIDHIFSLTSIIKNRKNRGLSIYIAYIDDEKAFDKVDRDLLLYKLLNIRRYEYGTAFWSIKAQIGTRRQIQAEPKASACIGDKYCTITHKFWSIQEVISTSLVVDNTCRSTIIGGRMYYI